MDTQILFRKDAQQALLEGATELYEAVATTLGPRGHLVAIDKGYGIPHITKDGVTVARAYDTDDPLKRMGAMLVKMVAAKTCDEAGDGTTSATVLSYSMMSNGMDKMQDVKNPNRFREGMRAACDFAVSQIRGHANTIAPDEIARVMQIATISANGDDEIGQIIASAIENVGNDGVITVEESSKGEETTVEVTTGFQWEKGLINPGFVTDPERIECVLDRPYVLVWGQNINYPQEILPMVQTAHTMKRALLVVAPNASNEVIKFLAVNAQQGVKVCFVKAPGYGQMQADLMGDLAVKVGAKVCGGDYTNAEQAGTDWLGEVERVVVNSNRTVLVGGAGTEQEVGERVAAIRHQIGESTNTYDREKFRERLSRLTGGAAVIYVAAGSEVEMKERKDRVDDAIAATRAALAEGYVPGGGTIQLLLARCLRFELLSLQSSDMDFNRGWNVVADALEEHFKTLCRNNAVEPVRIEMMIEAEPEINAGYDPIAGQIVDMLAAGIIDPAKVTRVALENSVSMAMQFLNMTCVMAAGKETK